MNRRQFLQLGPATLAALTAPSLVSQSIPPKAVEPPEIGRSTRRSPDTPVAALDLGTRQALRLLQMTDNHWFCGVKQGLVTTEGDQATERDWRDFVRIFSPDLIVLSGDTWHDNPGGRGLKTLLHVLPRLESLGVPWAFCWGNHDLLDDYQAGHDALEAARHSLYRGAANHGDYRIEIRVAAAGGPLPAAQLWLLNSNREGLTSWQLDWLRRARTSLSGTGLAPLPSLAFYHIPLLEQKTLYAAGRTPGVFQEEVCHEKEAGQAAPVLAADGRLLASFCGHDHVNDYAVRSRTLDLVYGRATGHAGYGGDKLRKGAKLIELDLRAATYQQVTVFADGTRWRPS
ncbi:MAG: metallophosphoesterase [Limisphaerales bacterium]